MFRIVLWLVVAGIGCGGVSKAEHQRLVDKVGELRALHVDELPGPAGSRIALMADSQLQTLSYDAEHQVRFVTGGWEDRAVAVAIRGRALDRGSRVLLDYFIDEVRKAKPELALYLGDGANNGCRDELEELLAHLKRLQTNAVPTFFVIGNHDYLGRGNVAGRDIRNKVCGGPDNVLSKGQVIELADKFNRASAELSESWSYESSMDLVRQKGTACSDYNAHHKCFLAGMLRRVASDTKPSEEIVLVDTSHYPRNIFPVLGWGQHGHISSEQVQWIRKRLRATDVRTVASHYPIKSIYAKNYWRRGKKIVGSLSFGERNGSAGTGAKAACWVSAHSHSRQPGVWTREVKAFTNGKWKKVHLGELNVGSTTDSEPHVALTRCAQSEPILLETKTVPWCEKRCDDVLRELNVVKAEQDGYKQLGCSRYLQVDRCQTSGRAILGVDASYRSWRDAPYTWDYKELDDYKIADANLELFTSSVAAKYHQAWAVSEMEARNRVELCLAHETGKLEEGYQPIASKQLEWACPQTRSAE